MLDFEQKFKQNVSMNQYPEPWKGRGSPYWYFTYVRPDGKRINKSTKARNKNQARNFIRQFIDQLQYTQKTLGEYCQPYYVWQSCPIVKHRLSEKKSIGTEHVQQQRGRIERYVLEDPIAAIKLGELKPGDLVDWRFRIQNQYSDGAANNAMKALKAVLHEALFRGEIERDPTLGIGNIKLDSLEVGVLTEEELAQLFNPDNAILEDKRKRLAIMLAVDAGLRRGELFALQWKHVIWEGHYLDVCRSWKSWPARELGLPKWGICRYMPMMERLEEELRTYQEEHLVGDEDLVICWDNRSPVSPGSWQRWVDAALEALKIDKKARNIKPHSFRHTLATRLEHKGVPGERIQAMLGHRQEKTTGIYIHMQPETLVQEMRSHFH